MPPSTSSPPVVLFGYDSSPFTNKVRLTLRIKQIPYTFVPVPSMMPRPILQDTFGLTYRKIPVLAIGTELYCDTSLIIEALERWFPGKPGGEGNGEWGTVYPDPRQRGLMRGLASWWFDRPFFRVTTGLIPQSVWDTSFGIDRASLIGHKLNPEKLGKKLPENLSNLDLHLSILEPHLPSPFPSTSSSPWLFPALHPSLADLSLYYQLRWGIDIAAGRGVYNLTSGGTGDTPSTSSPVDAVFNKSRYPRLWRWFHEFEAYVESLPVVERRDDAGNRRWKEDMRARKDGGVCMLPTPATWLEELDTKRGVRVGGVVSVAPDDTGRDDPTLGVLVGLNAQEVVVEPVEKGEVRVRIHFPRLGFVVRGVEGAKLRGGSVSRAMG